MLCILYGLIAVLALLGTWGNNLAYLHQGPVAANLAFWRDTLANPASRSITVDLFFLAFAVFVWMLLEARRLSMRGVWLYLILGMLIAISVTVPVFLINRELALLEREPSSPAGRLGVADIAGLIIVAGASAVYAALSLLKA
ncbi:DUF2834 domain-containing protein [Solimonas terrae]|uniref:DUF2834 domain-containing protein n=1 Tax=Solimonas terrae TaxID=1396819 RepID=A0A6M2BP79_9GAMM|nr:DUF2834 domain-containing protein [Solimonas terrae]